MSKCGWCKTPNLETMPNGDLEPHKIGGTNAKSCQGYTTYRETDESIGTDWWRLPW